MTRAHRMGARTAWLAILLTVVACAGTAQAAQPVVALTENNRLLTFEAAQPGTVSASVAITGMQAGENMLGIDFRPATGQLYGLGSTGRLYLIHPVTGVATQVGSGTFPFALTGSEFGFDFNPVVDRIRVVSNTELNFRVNPNTGEAVDGDPATAGVQRDTNLAYSAGDVNDGDDPNVGGAAYTNNFIGATTTTLYSIDASNNALVRQGGINIPPGTPSPNGGQLFTIGALGVDTDSRLGLDIAPVTGTAYAALTVGGTAGLYGINLASGAATPLGTIGDGTLQLRGLALPATVPTLYLATVGKQLVTASAATPGVNISSVAITGLGADQMLGIDFRPATGVLYALAGAGSSGRLYTIDPTTGVATQVGATLTLNGSAFGFGFDPLADRIRVVSDSEQNLRINPDDGSVVNDPPIPVPGSGVVGAAYLNEFPGAASTELLGIDFNFDTLVKINPLTPTIASVGPLGFNTSNLGGFDISPAGNLALASLHVGGLSGLYVVNTAQGQATPIGAFQGNTTMVGLATAPVGRFGITSSEVSETAGTATITVTRTAGTSGPASVDFAATAGTATAGSDFTTATGTLQWAQGETSKTFSIPIIDDTAFEGDETVNLALSNPLQGASLSTVTATLTIKEDESPPSDPGPTDPGPTDPGPTDPGPTDPGPTDPGPNVDDPAPILTKVGLTNRVLAARGTPKPPRIPTGTTFLFTLSENAKVNVAIDRIKPGRRVNGRCVKPRPRFRKRPRCKRYIRKGSIATDGKTGANRLRFSGRLRGKALAPGSYRARLRATDSAGQRSSQSTVRFRIVRR